MHDTMAVGIPFSGGETMPEFTTVSMNEATILTSSGRQKRYLPEYIAYIQQLPTGQAGRLRLEESEKPGTISRRLAVAAKGCIFPSLLSVQAVISISGAKTAQMNNHGRSVGIPDEGGQMRKRHRWIRHLSK
jgi:hypothetical protein